MSHDSTIVTQQLRPKIFKEPENGSEYENQSLIGSGLDQAVTDMKAMLDRDVTRTA